MLLLPYNLLYTHLLIVSSDMIAVSRSAPIMILSLAYSSEAIEIALGRIAQRVRIGRI